MFCNQLSLTISISEMWMLTLTKRKKWRNMKSKVKCASSVCYRNIKCDNIVKTRNCKSWKLKYQSTGKSHLVVIHILKSCQDIFYFISILNLIKVSDTRDVVGLFSVKHTHLNKYFTFLWLSVSNDSLFCMLYSWDPSLTSSWYRVDYSLIGCIWLRW